MNGSEEVTLKVQTKPLICVCDVTTYRNMDSSIVWGLCDNIQREEALICHQYNQRDQQVMCSLEGRGP